MTKIIPYLEKIPADLLTPVTAFLRLAQDKKQAFLFENVESGEKLPGFSFIGFDPFETLFIENNVLKVRTEDGSLRELKGNPFHEMGRYLKRYQHKTIPGLPPFAGGAVGYIGYECTKFLEPAILAVDQKDLDRSFKPKFGATLMLFRTLVAFDHTRKEIILISNQFETPSSSGASGRAQTEINELKRCLLVHSTSETIPNQININSELEITLVDSTQTGLSKVRFIDSVRKIKKHIRAGDIFQCVLSDKFTTPLNTDPFVIYRNLRSISPSPYLFYLKMNDEVLLGASPETLVKVRNRTVETSPIAGTRPRGKTENEDKKFERNLLNSTKEKAEHLMLVDLGRNDIGRISKPGSVTVPDFMEVKRFSHVMHLVSTVRGKLASGKSAWDALAACFPAGTLSGAPKIRAMQIISELEPVQRGTYGGAVVYHDFSGNLDSCIAIRSLYCADNKVYLQAGAGVVADSSPEREYEEVLRKLRSVQIALAMAEGREHCEAEKK